MTTPTAPPLKKPRRRWPKRLGKLLLGLILLVIGLVLGLSIYYRITGGNRLEAALAEANRTDPGWQWDDLQKGRAVVPDVENSALRVLAIRARLPEGWPDGPKGAELYVVPLEKAVREHPPEQQLDPELVQRLRNSLDAAEPALRESAELIKLPRGRFPGPVELEGWVKQTRTQLQSAREVADLLILSAALHAHERRPREALSATRAAFNAGRSVGDEPGILSQHVRLGCTMAAAQSLERILAQTEPSAEDLVALQACLEAEAPEPLLRHALRGERANLHEWMTALRAGRLERLQAIAHAYWHQDESSTPFPAAERWLRAGWIEETHARILEELALILGRMERPTHEQCRAIKVRGNESMAEWAAWYPLGRIRNRQMFMLLPAAFKFSEGIARSKALFGAAAVSLAAERYRLKHGRWPETLDQLVPEFFASIPEDPFVPQPLRMKRLEGGLMIYSVGRNEKDDDANIGKDTPFEGDLGFRLWDVDKRAQPKRPQGEENTP